MKAIESILLIIALGLIAIVVLYMVFFTGWVLPITGLLMALVMLEFVRIIAAWESKDKGVDKHE
jgi:CHASE2 domain-containing sensor protein